MGTSEEYEKIMAERRQERMEVVEAARVVIHESDCYENMERLSDSLWALQSVPRAL